MDFGEFFVELIQSGAGIPASILFFGIIVVLWYYIKLRMQELSVKRQQIESQDKNMSAMYSALFGLTNETQTLSGDGAANDTVVTSPSRKNLADNLVGIFPRSLLSTLSEQGILTYDDDELNPNRIGVLVMDIGQAIEPEKENELISDKLSKTKTGVMKNMSYETYMRSILDSVMKEDPFFGKIIGANSMFLLYAGILDKDSFIGGNFFKFNIKFAVHDSAEDINYIPNTFLFELFSERRQVASMVVGIRNVINNKLTWAVMSIMFNTTPISGRTHATFVFTPIGTMPLSSLMITTSLIKASSKE